MQNDPFTRDRHGHLELLLVPFPFDFAILMTIPAPGFPLSRE